MADPLTRDDALEIIVTSLQGQLRALRSLRKADAPPPLPARKGRKSNMAVIYDVLRAAGHPLHVNDIILQAYQLHGVTLKRESIVSALTKKVLDGATFRRTAPSTFALIDQDDLA